MRRVAVSLFWSISSRSLRGPLCRRGDLTAFLAIHDLPTSRVKRRKRTALLLGAGTLAAGASLLGTTQAHATLGTQPGGVSLSPASGSTTGTVTYSSTACPSGYQGSGLLRIVDPATGGLSNLARVNLSVASPFTGTLFADVLKVEATQVFPDLAGARAEIVMYCFSGPSATGSSEPVQDTYVTISADGATYSESSNGGSQPPATNGPPSTMELAASPDPAFIGQVVTLTARVAPSGATGSVQFSVGGTAIGSPVPVSDGWAATTTSFTAAGTDALSAVFTPAGNFKGSTANLILTVNAAPPNTGSIPLAVSVPATGSFMLTVDAIDTVTLTVSGSTARAATSPIVVSDTRNTFPGWSVSGQDTTSTGSGPVAGATISGNQLGWTPTSTSPLPQGVTLGDPVTPASPGLGTTPAVLALVQAGLYNGYGTATLGANLILAIPTPQAAGRYTSGLSITSVSVSP
jgi:hypothetical protein